MEFLGHWFASGLVMKYPANKHHKPPAPRSITSHQLTLKNHRKRPHWNNTGHYINGGGVTLPNNCYIRSPVMSHSLWIMSGKGLIADSIPLFTLMVSHLQLRQCAQPLSFQPGSILSEDTAINHFLTNLCGGVLGHPVLCPHCPYWLIGKRWILIPALCWLLWPPLAALISPLPAGWPSAVLLSLYL